MDHLRDIVAAGLVVCTALITLGILANWVPALDVVNDGFPFLAAGALALLALALFTGISTLIVGGVILVSVIVIVILLLAGLSGGMPAAPEGKSPTHARSHV